VTLVMPAWNPRADWLRQAVASALAQQRCVFELVIVDDGSERPIAELLADFPDPRLRILRFPHGGVSAARNAGLDVAAGTHIRFIDADDLLTPDSTARLLQLAGPNQGLIAYGATVFCDEAMRPLWKVGSGRRGSVTVECLLGRFPVTLPAMLFPRAVVERNGKWDTTMQVCEDWDYGLRALEHAQVVGTRGTVHYYRRHSTSASRAEGPAWDGAQRVVQRYFARHPEQRGTRIERSAHAMLSFMRSTHRARREIWRNRHLWRAVLLDPAVVVHGGAELLRTGRLGRAVYRRMLRPPGPVSATPLHRPDGGDSLPRQS
jgi:glycosyltransferase involved in cell wall biosynthesis